MSDCFFDCGEEVGDDVKNKKKLTFLCVGFTFTKRLTGEVRPYER